MDDEKSKQEEAKRILETIRQKQLADAEESSKVEKEIPRLPSEEAQQLAAFIDSTIKSKMPPPPVKVEEPEPVEIDPISTEQIKVMRKFAANKTEVRAPLKKTLSEFAIRAFFELITYFKPTNRMQKCHQDGHHTCVNCGEKMPLFAVPDPDKAKDAATGPASANPASH